MMENVGALSPVYPQMLVVFVVELICHFHSKNVPFTYSKTIDWAGHDFIHTFTILLFHTFTILLLFHTVTHYDDDGKWNLIKSTKPSLSPNVGGVCC